MRLLLGCLGTIIVLAACGEDGGFFDNTGGSTSSSTSTTGGQTSSATSGPGGNGAGGGSGGSTPLQAECDAPEDCHLINDCCECSGMPNQVDPPPCPEQCLQPKCSEIGFDMAKATCAVGRCVLDVSCNPATVTCEMAPPNCPPGEAPSVHGDCWGGCIPTSECSEVESCEACNGPNDTCVAEETQIGRIYHCVDAPSGCTDCECVGSSVCLAPFDTCTDVAPGAIACTCPTCDF